MCGIAGIIDARGLDPQITSARSWSACLDRLRRRGPDGSGEWISPSKHAALMHTRLAIVDPSARGHQPMVSDDGRVAITYNGEIYNAPQLREQLITHGHTFRSTCDTEVILLGWMHWGPRVVDHLRGMFAFAIWDDRTRELFAAVDHAGMKPFVWTIENDRFAFASDTDALRALTANRHPIDPIAIRHVLTMGCCPGEHTMWTSMHRLCAGRTLRWKSGQSPRIERFWTPPEDSDARRMDPDAFSDLWEHVVRDHLIADVAVGVFLSGGLDSASVTAAMTKVGANPTCFTLAMDGVDDESADAKHVADQLDLECEIASSRWDLEDELHVYSAAFDEPQGYSALLTQTRICAHASRRVKSILAGDGGDETFGGYLWQRETHSTSWSKMHLDDAWIRENQHMRDALSDPDTSDEIRNRAHDILASRSFVHGYIARVFPGFHPIESAALTQGLDGEYDESHATQWLIHEDRPQMDHLRRVQRLDLIGFCGASILPKVDRAGMHHALEIRAPMLDRRLIEYGLRAEVLDEERDPSGDRSRPDLRRYARNILGESCIQRSKQGFSLRRKDELDQWRRLASRVNDSKLVRGGYLRADWERFVPIGAVYRLRTICMLTQWAETRL